MADPLLPDDPARLGAYELTGRLGDGAPGVVYLGRGPAGPGAATGRPPFGTDSIPAVMHRILHTEPDLSVLPPALAGLVGARLAKDPARRPGAADVLTQLLGQVGAARPGAQSGDLLAQGASLVTSEIPVLRSLPQPRPPRPPRPPYGAPVPRRDNKAPLLIIGGAIVAVGLVVAGLLFVLRAKDDGTPAAAPPAG